jgi:tRNA modification GTPase
MRIETETTICAIATGDEGAPRGILRITGPDTIPLLQKLFASASDVFTNKRSARIFNASLTLPHLGDLPVSIFCWPTHRSYTGQPSAELHMLGAPILVREVEGALIAHGARLAQPGEFTLRAYLAGRMDLTQCEAVLGLIHAKGERAMRVALQQLAGGLSQPLQLLRRDLIHLLADIEAGLDFVDEDIEFISKADILSRLGNAKNQLSDLQSQLTQRAGQNVVPRVVLVGLPNAGKSTLLNALSREDIAIASETPGTTRDYLRSRQVRGDLVFDLVDTAGLDHIRGQRESAPSNLQESNPDRQAQRETLAQLQDAELILYCSAADTQGTDRDQACFHVVSDHAPCDVWRVITKSDLRTSVALTDDSISAHVVSAKRGMGLEELLEAVASYLSRRREIDQDVVPMTSQRCRESVERARQCIDQALAAVVSGSGDEVIAGELRMALDELGQVAGTVVNNDILDALFSRFCIGK